MSNEVKTKTTSLYEQMGGTYTEKDGIFYTIHLGEKQHFRREIRR